jgi:hypothetical protein
MLNNIVLDIFIGLIFIFLLYSLLATIIQEIIARWFNLRARMLVKAVRRMLEDDVIDEEKAFQGTTLFGFFDSFANLFTRFFSPIRKSEDFLKKFYNHPTIKYLGEDRMFRKPSYLHAHNFSQTIIHILRGDQYDGRTESESVLIAQQLQNPSINIKDETLRHLKMLFADSRQDAYIFKKKLEDWFDETMERSSGWYKKQTQTILLITGFFIAAAFNVDSIAISKILSKDKNVREQIVQLAVSKQKEYATILDTLSKTTTIKKEVKKPGDTVTTTIEVVIQSPPSDNYLDTTYKQLMSDADQVQNILGLSNVPSQRDSVYCKTISNNYDALISKASDKEEKNKLIRIKENLIECCYDSFESKSPYQSSTPLKRLGWLLTALAISLGAPFWFDLLNKFVKLRESGPKPNKTNAYDLPGTSAPVSNAVVDSNNNEIKG